MSARRFPTVAKRKAAVGGLAVAALTAAGLTLGPATAGATEDVVSTATAISASGVVTVEKTPDLDSSNGFQEKSQVSVETPGDLLKTGVLNAMVDTESSEASVADVKVSLSEILKNDMAGLSAAVVEAKCDNGEGSAALVDATIAGKSLDVTPPPNTEIGIPGLAGVTLNKQVTNDDGSVSVTAISLDLGVQQLDLSSVTCAAGAGGDEPGTDEPGDDNGNDDGGDEAPKPTPVEGTHPVTG